MLSGEEQGLYGGKLLAKYATAQGWQVEADLNNDIIGGTTGENGVHKAGYVRVFSEGTKSTETPQRRESRRYNGGEVDSPARNLARFIAGLAGYVPGFGVRMIYRTDRFERGGDQVPMLAAGYPAVRFTEAIENYTHEHQDVRTENGIAVWRPAEIHRLSLSGQGDGAERSDHGGAGHGADAARRCGDQGRGGA